MDKLVEISMFLISLSFLVITLIVASVVFGMYKGLF